MYPNKESAKIRVAVNDDRGTPANLQQTGALGAQNEIYQIVTGSGKAGMTAWLFLALAVCGWLQ